MRKSSLLAQATGGFLLTLHRSTDVVEVTSSRCIGVHEYEPDQSDGVPCRGDWAAGPERIVRVA
jgi:hypothetical protein